MKDRKLWYGILFMVLSCVMMSMHSVVRAATLESQGQASFFGNYQPTPEQVKKKQHQQAEKLKKRLADVNNRNQTILPRMSQVSDRPVDAMKYLGGMLLSLEVFFLFMYIQGKGGWRWIRK